MDEFFANIWNTLNLLVWSDWLTVIILIGFLIFGIKRGLAKELINLAFLILAIIIAWLFYQELALSPVITWLLLSHQSHLAIAFGVIFIGVLLIKKLMYRLTSVSSTISNPCALNRVFVLLLFFAISVALSWYYLGAVAGLGIMEIVITNESVRIALSFATVFVLITGSCLFISKIFNMSIESSNSCLLAPFFQKILNVLRIADTALNARNINSTKNKILGGLIGLVKGSLFILIMVLVLQSISWISQQYYWIETKGTLRTFQDVASDIKPELSQHLLFIENE
ncbi:CvpA family protein [Candidatus Thioglobus sp.]|jgi:Colicin V production protein.|uniref:CvpA family protein n=1 Tax=Candidatus Thioglobus sp. TaxID=2026721 RepID=UPI00324285EA